MTILQKIEDIKFKINFENNSFVRDTLYPIDFFVKKATIKALKSIASKCRIIEKSVFIPLTKNVRYYDINLSVLSKSKFDISQPKSLVIFKPSNEVVDISQAWIEQILANEFTDLYKLAIINQGVNQQLRASLNVDEFTEAGIFESIASIVDSDTITINTFSNATTNYYIVNLETADIGIYNYRKISSLSNPNLNLDSAITGVSSSWVVDGKVYISQALPTMLLFTFQGVPQEDYFTSNSVTIPIQSQFVSDIDDIIIKYLYEILASRDPKQVQVYSGLIQSGLLRTEEQVVTDIRGQINSRVTNPVAELYIPFTQYYGR